MQSNQAVESDASVLSKVPPVVFMFWVVKILATTVGETGGDALSMTLNLGYAVASLIFLALFAVTLAAQVASKRYHPFTYWAVVVATTTVGTTMSDYLDRTLKMGYVKSSILLFAGVLVVLGLWRWSVGRIAFENIRSRKEELFYWLTILVSNTLGTALGDFVATNTGLGFERGAIVFGGLILVVAIAHFATRRIPAAILFWAAYVLTRPLGATLGDTLTKAHAEGGLALGRISSSLAIGCAMAIAIVFMNRRSRARAA
ncbi:MAG: Membrane protein [Ramlibacter sp.]|nr:Membrane protein [Ramlibacter sp.]